MGAQGPALLGSAVMPGDTPLAIPDSGELKLGQGILPMGGRLVVSKPGVFRATPQVSPDPPLEIPSPGALPDRSGGDTRRRRDRTGIHVA